MCQNLLKKLIHLEKKNVIVSYREEVKLNTPEIEQEIL